MKIIDAWEGSMAHVGSIQPDSLWEFSNRKFCERFDEFGMTKKGFIDEFVSNFFSKYARRIK